MPDNALIIPMSIPVPEHLIMMRTILIAFAISVPFIVQAEITTSKDSLWLRNDPRSSRDDAIVLRCSSTDTIQLDSALLEFTELDTTGISYGIRNNIFTMVFAVRHPFSSSTYSFEMISLKSLGNNRFRLNDFVSSQKSLYFLPQNDSLIINRVEIGVGFDRNSLPDYPKYCKGTWRLFFSNRQETVIHLYSYDLRGVNPDSWISVSKDSLRIYNNPVSSFADEIRLFSKSSTPVHMDSAYIDFEAFDTTGSGTLPSGEMEAQWRERPALTNVTYLVIEPVSAKRYRMIQKPSAASNPVPLGFSKGNDTLAISMMEIGTCLNCSGLPAWFPPYVKGTMTLHFTSGQIIAIRLYSEDLRKPFTELPLCTDYTCDSIVVRKILDENEMADAAVKAFTTKRDGRIVRLDMQYHLETASSLPKKLKKLSPEIGRLSALEAINCPGNSLELIPSEIGKLEKLTDIWFDRNQLVSLPDSLRYCENLRSIMLDDNKLEKLPDAIVTLNRLHSLSVVANDLVTLPDGIEKLDSLQCIYIAGNRLCTLPDEISSWVKRMQVNELCTRFEPLWPSLQDCSTSVNILNVASMQNVSSRLIRNVTAQKNSVVFTTDSRVRNVQLFTASGQLLSQKKAVTGDHGAGILRLSFTSQQTGICYLRATAADQKTETRKILIMP